MTSTDVRHRPGRQPRRDRRAGHPHAARDWASARSRSSATPTPTPATCARPTSRCGIGPAPARAELPRHRRGRRRRPAHRRAGGPPRLRVPLRERGFAARAAGGRASCSSARRSRRSRRWATRSRAKAAVSAFGVPVVPGSRGRADRRRPDRRRPTRSAIPVLVKPSAGGGGKGMRVVHDAAELPAALAAARREARVGVRRRHPAPRAVRSNPAAHRGAGARRRLRQRRPPRRARVLPAAPPPEGHRGGAVAAARRRRPGPRIGAARRATPPAACDYAGAGTVEFIVSARPARRVLLHGDEHPAAGRAPGHRAGHRPRPGRAAAAHRGGRAAADRAGRRHA